MTISKAQPHEPGVTILGNQDDHDVVLMRNGAETVRLKSDGGVAVAGAVISAAGDITTADGGTINGTVTPTADQVPKANASGYLAPGWLPPAGTYIQLTEDYVILQADLQSRVYPGVSGAGGSVADLADPGGHPGIAKLIMGTTNNTGYAASWTGASIKMRNGAIDWEALVGPSDVGDSGADYTFFAGLLNQITAAPTIGCFFKYNKDNNSGKLQAVCTNGSTTTTTNLDYTWTALTWVKLRIVVAANGATVEFYINGTLVATITTNVYDGATNVGLGAVIQKTASGGTTDRYIFIDLQNALVEVTPR